MFTHHRPINRQNRWLLTNTKTAVAALELNGLDPTLSENGFHSKLDLYVILSPLKITNIITNNKHNNKRTANHQQRNKNTIPLSISVSTPKI